MANINQKLENLQITLGEGGTIKSIDLVGIINTFREVEGKRSELKHKHFIEKIRKEIEILEKIDINSQPNFRPSNYTTNRGKTYECYELDEEGMLMMLNSESTVVRYKTTQYIKQLKEQLQKAKDDIKELTISNEKLYQIATNEADDTVRLYKANVEKYRLRNVKNLLMSASYKNIDEVMCEIVKHHTTELKKSDRYEYYQAMTDKEYKQFVRSYLYDMFDYVRAERRSESVLCEVCSEIQKQLQKDYIKTDHFSQGKTDKIYEKKIQTLQTKVAELEAKVS